MNKNILNAMKVIIICLLFISWNSLVICAEYVSEYNGMDWNERSFNGKANIINGIFIGQNPSSLDGYYETKYRYAENTTNHDYVKELDSFYLKPKHRKIKILDAYVLATIKFQDNDSNDYKYTLKMMLEEKTLPHKARVIRIIDGDTIEVSDILNYTIWKVRLICIDAPEINHKTQKNKEKYGMLSKNFLSTLCLGEGGSLFYTEDIFDKYGRLLAGFIIPRIFEKDTNVIKQLLIYGLAKPYAYQDPKRNYDNSSIEKRYKLNEIISFIAKEKQLYIWGDKKSPYVEKLITPSQRKRKIPTPEEYIKQKIRKSKHTQPVLEDDIGILK